MFRKTLSGIIGLLLIMTQTQLFAEVSGTYISDGSSFAIFDGVDDHLQITPSEMGTAFQFSGSFSIEAWVYRDNWNDTTLTNQSIISYTDFGGYALQIRHEGNLAFKVYSETAGAYEYTTYSHTGLSAGWHHIAAVRIASSDLHRLYIDGVLVASSSGSGGTLSYEGNNYFEIGAESDADAIPEDNGYFEGAIDEVRVWNTDLDATDISNWMYKIITDTDRPTYYTDLVGYYKLDTDWPSEYGGFLDDAAGNVGGSGDYDLSGSNYSTDNAPRLIDGYYRVGYLDHLVWMSANYSARMSLDYRQANDIDASATDTLNSGEGFNSIGDGNNFIGSYRGSGYTISDLTINRPTGYYKGFFGIVHGAVIDSLTLSSIDITAHETVGGFAGIIRDTSRVSTITVSGTVNTDSYSTGGFVGKISDDAIISNSTSSVIVTGGESCGGFAGLIYGSPQINNCSSTGTVTNEDIYTGGFIGKITGGSISACFTTGDVSSTSYVGGFVGFISSTTSPTITNSYSRGNVTASNYNGGFIGINDGGDISNCYSTGNVSNTISLYDGGFVGRHTNGNYSNSFWDMNTSGLSNGSGYGSPSGITGKTTAEMTIVTTFTDENSEGLSAAWDFENNPFDDGNSSNDWDMDSCLNNGYPELTWTIASDHTFATAVYTLIPSATSQSTGTGGGFVRAGSSISARGICWSTSSSPTISDSKTTDGSTTGNFSSSMDNLLSHYTYYVRAYITDGGTTYYGEEYTIYPTHTVTEPVLENDYYQITSLENLGWICEDTSR